MKRISYVLVAVLALGLTAASFPGMTKLSITSDSKMWVDGTSTIHGWTCEVGKVQGSITLDAAAGQVSDAVVTVPAAALDCDSGTMNSKAEEALKMKAHPTIKYTLKNAAVTKDGENLRIKATGSLELAGVKKDVTSELVGEPAANGGYTFTGKLPITMSNFGIKPPTAMLGTLKTGDDVTVRFELAAVPSGNGSVSSAK